MKQRVRIASMVVGVVTLAIIGFVGLGSSDDAVHQKLGALGADQVALTDEVTERSCQCLREMGHPDVQIEGCLDERRRSETELAETRECITDVARELHSDPPPFIDEFIECGATMRQEILGCIDAVADADLCAPDSKREGTPKLLECISEHNNFLWDYCMSDANVASRRWLTALNVELRNRRCVQMSGKDVDVGGVDDDKIRIDVHLDAIFVDGREVMGLSRGTFADDGDMAVDEPLEALLAALEEVDHGEESQIRTHSLVPFATKTRVYLNAKDFGFSNIDRDEIPLDGSKYDDLWIDEYPMTRPHYDRNATARNVDGDKVPLDLEIHLAADGINVTKNDEDIMAPIEGCGEPGPTICLRNDAVDPKEAMDEARRAYSGGDGERAAKAYDEAVEAYDLLELYNLTSQLSDKYRSDALVIITADSDLPMGLLKQIADTVAVQLDRDSYGDVDAFWDERATGRFNRLLFADPTFVVHYP